MSLSLHPGYDAIEKGLLFFHCYCRRPRLWRHASASELAPHVRPSPVSKYLHFVRTNSNSSMKTAGAVLPPLRFLPGSISSERRGRDRDHVAARAGLGPGLGPADRALEIVVGGGGLGQRDGDCLRILRRAARKLP